MKKKTHEKFVEQLKERNPNIKVIGHYVNDSTKIDVECLSCGYIWGVAPNSLLRGSGCPKCARNIRKTTQQFIEEMNDYNPHIEVLGEYVNAHTPIRVRCKLCGFEWSNKPNRLLRGNQCMNCIKPHTSFMEQFMLIAFENILGKENVRSRDKSAIGMELDIYIPKYSLAIETGSWLYHERKVYNTDLLKRRKCTDANIRLITIYDSFPKDVPSPFDKDCYVFEGFLNEYGYKRIIRLVDIIAQSIGVSNYIIDWADVASKAYEECHYNADALFRDKLSKVAPTIEVLEQYKGNNIPILVNNTACLHPSWRARPYTLLRGVGCPLCGIKTAAKSNTRTQDQFVNRLEVISPDITVIGEYKGSHNRIKVRCDICGNEWEPLAYALLNGKGCPHCSAIKAAKKRNNHLASKTTEQFQMELSAINPNIKIMGEYFNNKTKIKARCLVCGYEWNVVPASLLNGHGCPKCGHKRKSKQRE